MITIRDWVATIPDADKHIAYVGEDGSVFREFLLTGNDWKVYRNWTFYLDMAFDLSSVTKRDSRKVVATQQDTTKTESETQVKTTSTGKTETYTVEAVQVDAPATTDVVYLPKREQEDGLVLRWKVQAQHTHLPGKLTATLRALGTMGEVKKSALMVFEVDPAVLAEPAAPVPQSTFNQMLAQMSAYCETGHQQAMQTAQAAADAALSASQVDVLAANIELTEIEVGRHKQICEEKAGIAQNCADTAEEAMVVAGAHSQRAEEDAELAIAAATEARQCAATARLAAAQTEALIPRLEAMETTVGDVDTALDAILDLQNTWIGGGAV